MTYLNRDTSSPSDYIAALGYRLDCSRYGNPAIIGPSGKEHCLPHGYKGEHGPEAVDVLHRLCRMKGILR